MLPIRQTTCLAQNNPILPQRIFEDGTQGVLYDPTDFTTLFQDSAGTTPVTALEQPVGLMLDKSGRSNHAYAVLPANRPTLTARYNMLTSTAALANQDVSITVAGTHTVNFVGTGELRCTVPLSQTSRPWRGMTTLGADVYACVYNGDIYKQTGGVGNFIALSQTSRLWYGMTTLGSDVYVSVNDGDIYKQTGGVGNFIALSQTSRAWRGITTLGSDVYASVYGEDIYKMSFHAAGSSSVSIPAVGTVRVSVTGSVTSADLRTSNDGVGLPTYQRVTSSTDYDAAGFPPRLYYNGTNSYLMTNNIDFSATDKMFVCVGVRKLSDVSKRIVVELSNTDASNNGTFAMTAPNAASTTYAYESKGTSLVNTSASTYASPSTNVLTGVSQISTPATTLRINGTQVATSGVTQGSGNYGTFPLYIGARVVDSLYFSGYMGPMVIAGKALTDMQVTDTEKWINSKMKVYKELYESNVFDSTTTNFDNDFISYDEI